MVLQMPSYTFWSDRIIGYCALCPMLSHDSKTCGLGMFGPHHEKAIRMLDHPEWLFDKRPNWCTLMSHESRGVRNGDS